MIDFALSISFFSYFHKEKCKTLDKHATQTLYILTRPVNRIFHHYFRASIFYNERNFRKMYLWIHYSMWIPMPLLFYCSNHDWVESRLGQQWICTMNYLKRCLILFLIWFYLQNTTTNTTWNHRYVSHLHAGNAERATNNSRRGQSIYIRLCIRCERSTIGNLYTMCGKIGDRSNARCEWHRARLWTGKPKFPIDFSINLFVLNFLRRMQNSIIPVILNGYLHTFSNPH